LGEERQWAGPQNVLRNGGARFSNIGEKGQGGTVGKLRWWGFLGESVRFAPSKRGCRGNADQRALEEAKSTRDRSEGGDKHEPGGEIFGERAGTRRCMTRGTGKCGSSREPGIRPVRNDELEWVTRGDRSRGTDGEGEGGKIPAIFCGECRSTGGVLHSEKYEEKKKKKTENA